MLRLLHSKFFIILGIIIVMLLFPLACLTSSAQQSPSNIPITMTGSPAIQVEEFAANLNVPWEMAFAPDGRIFITERPGSVRLIQNGQIQSDPWITLDVAADGEGGLLGLALDPDFSNNHFVYAAYTYKDSSGNLKNRLERLTDNPAVNKGTSSRVILENALGASNHDGGRVKFGPDGKIYWTLGDAGNADLAQDLNSLNGKILRINLDGSIPTDNPFPNSFIYSYGNRNPEGLAWQSGTGRLYATEHGSSAQDEVNYIEPGKNYGWPVIRGDQTHENMVNPVIHSGTDTWAPSGATFVSGGLWDGSLLFAGLRGQSLYRLSLDKTDPFKVLLFERYFNNQYGRIRDVVQGPDGAIYFLTNNRDGRGVPRQGDDKILKVTIK